ncbi:cytochrome c peroxidase [Chitinimonas viridis]|uniref:Cytochrome c peroxidase n=1 Tax=Chitinimonas viridis TaxID=664880 RepID=A0ABT8BAY3_9NEIS|nr:cytochrome c peroxidase [Chitinimonas viridis]MDN3578892.1 cytochrome c peroxidase [Chitinimonas viridis]
MTTAKSYPQPGRLLGQIASILLAGLAAAAEPPQPLPIPATGLSATASIGRSLFFDPNLSASGRQSCASCHHPGNSFSAPNNLAVQLGGAALDLQGLRNTPTASYTRFVPTFTLNPPPPPGQPRPSPARGGLLHDGRANTLAIQAQGPFLTAFEMGNRSAAEVLQRLRTRPYLTQFRTVFGAATLNNPDATLAAMGRAIAAYEQEEPSFRLFNSKFDAVTNGRARFSPREANGQRLFNDPNRGNCASCHTARPTGGVPALFTDHSYRNLGIPRNWAIPYNRDDTALPGFITANGANLGAPNHLYYDMGLCGPVRTDLAGNRALCGMFRVPTLRNVAVKQAYFHNGIFSTLNQVISFYTSRELTPARWYTKADGSADIRYNDLPTALTGNITQGPPFRRNGPPALNEAEIRDMTAFLCTLTDGYDPQNPAAYRQPAQCVAAAN